MIFRFQRLNYYKFLLGSLLLIMFLQSCVKDELNNLSGNVRMQQNFSVPLGSKELYMEAPPISRSSSIPGAYGTFYYNGLPYPAINAAFPALKEDVDLNLSNKTQTNWITRLTLSIVSENSFPIEASLQVYMLDGNGNIFDNVFENPIIIEGAPVDANHNVIKPAINITPIVYEGIRLDLLKQSKVMQYIIIPTKKDQSTIWLSDANNFKVTIGARIELLYNINEVAQ